MRRRRHIKGPYDRLSRSAIVPSVSGGAELRLERGGASTASVTWHDSSGKGNNGTAADAAMFADFYFDSIVDEVITAQPEPSHDFSSDWTLALWYKRDTSIATGYNTIIQTRVAGPNGGYIFRDRNTAAVGDYSFEVLSPYQILGTAIAGTDSDWHFACLVWTVGSPNRLNAYIDGAPYASLSTASAPVNGGVLQIGRGNYYRFSGYLDTVRSYPRALSADEIARDYNVGKVQHQ